MKRLLTAALALLVALPAAAAAPRSSAALDRAIENVDFTAAKASIDALVAANTVRSFDALVKAFDKCARESEAVEKKMRVVTAVDAAQNKDPKKLGKQSAEGRALKAELTAKLGGLKAIRAVIAKGFGKFTDDAVVEKIISRMKGSANGEFRSYMAGALQTMDRKDAYDALLDQLPAEKDVRVKVALADALGAKRGRVPERVEALCGLLGDRSWPVLVATARAIRRTKSLEAVGRLIDALEGAAGREQDEINQTLAALTGVDKHGSHAAWQDWWGRNRQAVLAGSYTPEPAERAGGQAGGTTFYGLPVVSRRPVFVIDASMSMKRESKWKPGKEQVPVPGGITLKGTRKIDVAQYELKKVLAMMPDGAEFNIVFFHQDVDVFKPMMETLNESTRKEAFRWIDALVLVLQTNIYEGVKRAFDFTRNAPRGSGVRSRETVVSGADTIYLLSDGQPTTGIKKTTEFVTAVGELNRVRKVAIHTIAIEPSTGSANFLKKLATANHGQYAARGQKDAADAKKKRKKK